MKQPDWMKQLGSEQGNEEFSQLCHEYFKLAMMRCMQEMRDKYNIPPSDMTTILLAISARLLNEGCYALGAAIKNGMSINDILPKDQQSRLLKIFMNQPLDILDRDDIDTDLKSTQEKFKRFIMENASDFYVNERKN